MGKISNVGISLAIFNISNDVPRKYKHGLTNVGMLLEDLLNNAAKLGSSLVYCWIINPCIFQHWNIFGMLKLLKPIIYQQNTNLQE